MSGMVPASTLPSGSGLMLVKDQWSGSTSPAAEGTSTAGLDSSEGTTASKLSPASSFHRLYNHSEFAVGERRYKRYDEKVRRERSLLDFRRGIKLKGRDAELATIQDVTVKASLENGAQLVLLSGRAGAGKTFFVQEASRDKKWFVAGKYDQFMRSQPYTAIVEAMKELISIVCLSAEFDEISLDFKQKMGPNSIELVKLIPEFAEIFDSNEDEEKRNELSLSLDFLKSAFRAFLQSVTFCMQPEEGPLVISIDDVHWADSASFQLIESLTSDESVQNTIIVAGYRDNEADRCLNDFLDSTLDSSTRIHMADLAVPAVREIITDLTKRKNDNDVHQLADIIVKRTGGNPFFVKEFIRDLQNEELLAFSLKTYRYEWEVNKILARMDLSENVVDLISSRLGDISEVEAEVLKVASCLGSRFPERLLATILCGSDGSTFTIDEITEIMERAEARALIDKVQLRDGVNYYRFVHDRVQQGAYDLLKSLQERADLHWRIGVSLLGASVTEPSYSFAAVEQINTAVALGAKNTFGYVKLAQLNLETAQKARAKYSFVPAVKHLRTGIALLSGASPWDRHYNLMMPMYTLLAEIEVGMGHFEAAYRLIEEALLNATSAIDAAPFYVFQTKALVSEQKGEEATDAGLAGLKALGMKVNKRVSKFVLIRDILLLKRRWKKIPDEELYQLPDMLDEKSVLISDQVASIVAATFFTGNNELSILVTLNQIKLQLEHGLYFSTFYLCVWSCIMAMMNDIKEARRIGKLVVHLQDRPSTRVTPSSMCLRYISVHPLTNPVHDSIDPLMAAYNLGIISGEDPLMSCLAGTTYLEYCIFCGSPLKPLEKMTLRLFAEMKRYKQKTAYGFTYILRTYISNLIGGTAVSDPLVLGDDIYNEATMLSSKDTDPPLKTAIRTYKAGIIVFFRGLCDPGVLEPLFSMSIAEMRYRGLFVSWAIYPALAMLDFAKAGHQRRKNLRRSRRIMVEMAKCVKTQDVNALLTLKALEVQYDAVTKRGTPEKIKTMFDFAISTSRRSGFVQFAGLLSILAAEFFLDSEDTEQAIPYAKVAMECYERWGATNLIRVMRKSFTLRRGSSIEYAAVDEKGGRASGAFMESDFIRLHEGKATLEDI